MWEQSLNRASNERRAPSEAEVRTELARLLASDVFSRSERLSAFLAFIVDRTLIGQADTLKEAVVGMELYGKDSDFDPAADPIVRVDARRLRDKLRESYAAAPASHVIIEVPKGGYTPHFTLGPPTPLPVSEPTRLHSTTHGWWIAIAVAVLGVGTWGIDRWRSASLPPETRLLTVTSFPGAEGMPSISPDGNFVTFTWTGPVATETADVWVKAVEGEGQRQLTNTPEFHEAYPSWSPDGREIAFQRHYASENRGVYVVSQLGGQERQIVSQGWMPSWTPDGRGIVFSKRLNSASMALFVHDLTSGATRQLTFPGGFNDQSSKVSPDGKTIAFARSREYISHAALFLVPIEGGEPHQLTAWSRGVGRFDWTPDGKFIIYPQVELSGMQVLRIPVSGGTPVPVAGMPLDVNMVGVSGFRKDGTYRVGLGYGRPDVGMRLLDLRQDGTIASDAPFVDSVKQDQAGRFSRDGTRVAFTSNRTDVTQAWVSNRDGSGLIRIPGTEGLSVSVGAWSPDGGSLTFEQAVGNTSQIYTVQIEGGNPVRLTTGEANNVDPEWSRDGKWVYYASTSSGRSEIWKTPSTGGTPVQLTHEGGFGPRESSDGHRLYYVDKAVFNGLPAPAKLRQLVLASGEESTILEGVPPGAWDVTDRGIFFVTGAPGAMTRGVSNSDELEFYSFEDGQVHRIGAIPFLVARFGVTRLLIASRDGRSIVIGKIDRWDRDILVMDGVR